MNMNESKCIFCGNEILSKKIFNNEYFFAVLDNFPVTEGHILLISKRHEKNFFKLEDKEKTASLDIIEKAKKYINENYEDVTGYNIGINIGSSAGQTVSHCHIHIIPRRENDTEKPEGGVRGVIPKKMKY